MSPEIADALAVFNAEYPHARSAGALFRINLDLLRAAGIAPENIEGYTWQDKDKVQRMAEQLRRDLGDYTIHTETPFPERTAGHHDIAPA